MSTTVVKGNWAPDEDERLMNAIKEHGTRYAPIGFTRDTLTTMSQMGVSCHDGPE